MVSSFNKFIKIFQKAAGDFNKGIVGDSERMLNEIADRAQLVPWETCFMIIDEIDSLAPDRTKS
jgi:ATP-dependent 26S proteasome regulatory subunit